MEQRERTPSPRPLASRETPTFTTVPLTDTDLRRLPPLRPTERITPTGRVREFRLAAERVRWELVKGVWVDAWAFNGQVPGPTIRVTEGDKVRVTVENRLQDPTSIHWHGLHVPNPVDGVPPVTEHGIQPGQTHTYEFVANHAGTFMYHSHSDEIQQVDKGLTGAFIIDPQDAGAEPDYHHDVIMVFNGWMVPPGAGADHGSMMAGEGGATSGHAGHGGPVGAKAPESSASGHKHEYNYWTINGKAYPDVPTIQIHTGDRVRLRMINISQDVHPMHLHGHDFRVIAMDGHPLQQPLILNTVNVVPGQTVDVDFIANNPGRWMFHCHILHHASNNMQTPGGLTALFDYEGVPESVEQVTH